MQIDTCREHSGLAVCRSASIPGRQNASFRGSPSILAVTTLDHLDAARLRAVVEAYKEALAAHREPINRLNVYPVPDGDTGTNMALTLSSVVDGLAEVDRDDLAAVCKAISHGSQIGRASCRERVRMEGGRGDV